MPRASSALARCLAHADGLEGRPQAPCTGSCRIRPGRSDVAPVEAQTAASRRQAGRRRPPPGRRRTRRRPESALPASTISAPPPSARPWGATMARARSTVLQAIEDGLEGNDHAVDGVPIPFPGALGQHHQVGAGAEVGPRRWPPRPPASCSRPRRPRRPSSPRCCLVDRVHLGVELDSQHAVAEIDEARRSRCREPRSSARCSSAKLVTARVANHGDGGPGPARSGCGSRPPLDS